MGYVRRREVADALPAGLTASERLVALEIADAAHDTSRRAYGAELVDTVLRRAGIPSIKQLGKLLGGLARKGVELREVAFQDVSGRPVVAWRGHATTFAVPPVEALRAACQATTQSVDTQGDVQSRSV